MVSHTHFFGLNALLALVWIVTVALPTGWHKTYGSVLGVDYDLCLYKYAVTKGKAGKALEQIGGMIGGNSAKKINDKVKSAYELLDVGTHYLSDVEDEACKLTNAVAIPGIKEWCYMWRSIRNVSYAVIVCVCLGAALMLGAAGLSFTSPTGVLLKFSQFGGLVGAFLAFVCILVYSFMTWNFPEANGTAESLSFGPVFWVSFAVGVLALGASAAGAAMVPAAKDAGQGEKAGMVEFQNFGGQQPPAQQSMQRGMPPGMQPGMPAMQPGMQPGMQQGMMQPGMPPPGMMQYQHGGMQTPGSAQMQMPQTPVSGQMQLGGRMLNFDANGNLMPANSGNPNMGPMSSPFAR